MTKEKIIEAIEIFGDNVVSEVRTLVDVSDPDGCYTMFEDMECLNTQSASSFFILNNP